MARTSLPQRRVASRERRAVEKLSPVLRLRQKRGGREKRIATGFAWDLFLFSGVFGLPLFWRRLHAWGAIVLAFWCLDLVIGRVPVSAATARGAEAALFAAFLLLQLWLGFAGNRLTARAYLAHGWEIAPPLDLATKQVIRRWKLVL